LRRKSREAELATYSIVLNSIGNPEWNAPVYGALSFASRLAISLRHRGKVLQLARLVHRANRYLQDFFEVVDEAMEGKRQPARDAETLTPERLKAMGFTLVQLHQTMKSTYDAMAEAGLTNNSVIASSLVKYHAYSERILDLADWLESAQLSDYVREVFDRAATERARGAVFSLDGLE
jgi:hypothetical protein